MVAFNKEYIKTELVNRIKPFDPDRIILFGSWAYGTPTEESDIDICVVKNSLSRHEEMESIRRSLRDIPFEKDILIESAEFLESHSGKEWINSAWYDIVHDGIVLYEKS